jgi:hypothetical protein
MSAISNVAVAYEFSGRVTFAANGLTDQPISLSTRNDR